MCFILLLLTWSSTKAKIEESRLMKHESIVMIGYGVQKFLKSYPLCFQGCHDLIIAGAAGLG